MVHGISSKEYCQKVVELFVLSFELLKCRVHCCTEVDTDIRNAVTSADGETITLECRESVNKDVTWQYQKTPSHTSGYVYYIGTHYQQPRFNVNHSISNQYDLVISNDEVADSGKYICIEDGGQGIRHVYNLSVVGTQSLSSLSATRWRHSVLRNYLKHVCTYVRPSVHPQKVSSEILVCR